MLSKEQRIKREANKLKKIFAELPKNRYAITLPLIEEAAFLKITLAETRARLLEDGTTDDYQNGANQHGTKVAAELQAYNALTKSYCMIFDRLEKIAPPGETRDRLAELLQDG